MRNRRNKWDEWAILAWDNVRRYENATKLETAALYGVWAGRLIHECQKNEGRRDAVAKLIRDERGKDSAEVFMTWMGTFESGGVYLENPEKPTRHFKTMSAFRAEDMIALRG